MNNLYEAINDWLDALQGFADVAVKVLEES